MPLQLLLALHQVMYTGWPNQSTAEALLAQMVQFRWNHQRSCVVWRSQLGSWLWDSVGYCHFSHRSRYHFVSKIHCHFPWSLISYNFKASLLLLLWLILTLHPCFTGYSITNLFQFYKYMLYEYSITFHTVKVLSSRILAVVLCACSHLILLH